MSANESSICRCRRPPFHYQDYERAVLGDDRHWAEVSVDRCKFCGTYWLKYLIEEAHHTASGRWWRVILPESDRDSIQAEDARAFIERQASGFYGGSHFASRGDVFNRPPKIR
jgi:hypothetical protein